jgi:hypothetical protein
MRGSLLPRAAPPHLPHAARRWEALAATAPHRLLHSTTRVWRCGRCLLLRLTWVTAPQPSRATMMNALTSERSTHMNAASRFQLFSIITKCIRLFSDSKVENKLAYIKKELQQIKKDNVALARYINARRKKEETQRKEEAQKRWRSRPEGRRWCWRRRPMRAKAPRMSGLEGSSSPRMVQDLSLLLLAHIFC